MRTAVDNAKRRSRSIRRYWAATNPIEPIHEYNIPILPFKHPPTQEDFTRTRKRQKRHEQPHEQMPTPPADDGHIDEYA